VEYLGFREIRQNKSRKVQEDIGINNDNELFLQLSSCMHDFLAIFGMHDTCIWFLGHDLSLSWRFAWIDISFS